jgi:uncharacterized protein YjbI with pentapeptide repeats
MMAALVVSEGASGSELLKVRRDAWSEYGRGIDLSRWHFPRGRFDHATMARINLQDADLQKAVLDFTNLIGADLRGAKLGGASLRYADLSRATLQDSDKIRTVESSETNAKAGTPAAKTVIANGRLDLSNADLTEATLNGADLTNARELLLNARN